MLIKQEKHERLSPFVKQQTLKVLQKDTGHMVLTADKGIALVVMNTEDYNKMYGPSQ